MFHSFWTGLKTFGLDLSKIPFMSFGKLHIDCFTEKIPFIAVCLIWDF